jgi:hypothetical protein
MELDFFVWKPRVPFCRTIFKLNILFFFDVCPRNWKRYTFYILKFAFKQPHFYYKHQPIYGHANYIRHIRETSTVTIAIMYKVCTYGTYVWNLIIPLCLPWSLHTRCLFYKLRLNALCSYILLISSKYRYIVLQTLFLSSVVFPQCRPYEASQS